MFSQFQKRPKLCWSIVAKIFSEINPLKALVWYLYISGQIVNADNSVKKTFFIGSDITTVEPSSACVTASPGCLLSVQGIFSNNALTAFKVQQDCDESEFLTYIGRDSLGNQIKDGRFHGTELCDGALFNKKSEDATKTRYRHNTDYSIHFTDSNKVDVTYRP